MADVTIRGLGFHAGGGAILEGIDLQVRDGEFLALLGPSGCGKSSFLRLLAGFERASSGSIRIDGQLVSGPGVHLEPEAREIGMVFQSYALWPHMDVAGNVGFALRLRRMDRKERAGRVAEALAVVGLAGFESRRVQSLSGGQRQRVALARCLAMRPRLLLLDEPLANLDAHLRETMVDEFRRLHRATGATIVFVTHDQAEAMALADRIAVMDAGRMVQVGAPAQLWREPATASIARFIGKGQVVPVEVLGPVAPGQVSVRFLGHVARLRAPAGFVPGPALACLRPADLAIVPQGDGPAMRVLDQIEMGHATVLTLQSVADPGLTLRLSQSGPSTRAEVGARLVLGVQDGWVLPQQALAAE